jgi:hypothetical protein
MEADDACFAISGTSTTLVEITGAFWSLLSSHELGTPAARQMLSHKPWARKSACADGRRPKPISIEAIVKAVSAATLIHVHLFDRAKKPLSRITVLQLE